MGGLLCGLVGLGIGIFLWLGIGAIILRVACSMVRVDVPEFGRAMLITFLSGIANAAVGFVVDLVIGGVMGAGIMASILSFSVNLCVAAAIYSAMLETTFGKGILIWLAQLVVLIIIIASVYAIVLGLGVAVR